MSHSTARHTHDKSSGIAACGSFSITILCRFVHELIECRVDIVCELNLRNGLHALSGASNRKANYALFCQGGVKDAIPSKLGHKPHATPEYPAEGDIFAEQQRCVVGAEGVRESSIDRLKEVQS